MEKSIYRIICANIKDGMIDRNFKLETNKNSGSYCFAPGALDGIMIYHSGFDTLDAASVKSMSKAVRAAEQMDFFSADKLFQSFCEDHRAVAVVDDLQRYVAKHARRFNTGNILQTAMYLILHSANIECVKIGLELLELYGEPEENVKEIIRRLGLYDEFTIFTVWNMLQWTDGNDEIFRLARNVFGWGRIHAVERLEPETDEIKHWLLTEGTVNGVENAYSSLTCWKKSGAEQLLSGRITREEYDGISILLEGLLDEGPVPGISELDHADHILMKFLKQSMKFQLTWENYDVIHNIMISVESEEDSDIFSRVAEKCYEILHSQECLSVITDAVSSGNAFPLASMLHIPYKNDLYRYLKSDFGTYYYQCHVLISDQDYRQDVMDIFRKYIPLDGISQGTSFSNTLHEDYETSMYLMFMLQELIDLPLQGMDFVKAGLMGSNISAKFMAIRCLENWVTFIKKLLAELSPELYEIAEKSVLIELNEEQTEKLKALLEGKIDFILEDDPEYSGEDDENE